MSKAKQKLELTWIGKEKTPKLEPRIGQPPFSGPEIKLQFGGGMKEVAGA